MPNDEYADFGADGAIDQRIREAPKWKDTEFVTYRGTESRVLDKQGRDLLELCKEGRCQARTGLLLVEARSGEELGFCF